MKIYALRLSYDWSKKSAMFNTKNSAAIISLRARTVPQKR